MFDDVGGRMSGIQRIKRCSSGRKVGEKGTGSWTESLRVKVIGQCWGEIGRCRPKYRCSVGAARALAVQDTMGASGTGKADGSRQGRAGTSGATTFWAGTSTLHWVSTANWGGKITYRIAKTHDDHGGSVNWWIGGV